MTERWCQAVRELYELQQNSAGDRKGNFAQNSIANAITYGSFRDDVPNKFDKQQFLFQSNSNGSANSASSATDPNRIPSQSPLEMFDILAPQTPQYEKPNLLYPPTAEITPAARRKAEERAVLEAMTQTASLPVSPYLGPGGWIEQQPGDESFQFGTYVPLGYGMQNHIPGIGMEDFPSLDEIISSMEGGVDTGFGFLDDLNLFDTNGMQ